MDHRRSPRSWAWIALFACGCSAASGSSDPRPGGHGGALADASADDASTSGDDGSAGASSGDAAGGSSGADAGLHCTSESTDLAGCSCASPGASLPCWPTTAPAPARGVGPCHDGAQTCAAGGEFPRFDDCAGAVTPVSELCSNGADDDCNGVVDCADPGCALDAACQAACTDGDTRPCYDGPVGTLNVGTCRAGVQTCAGGQWGAVCTSEVLPAFEDCTDLLDHNCNFLRGCDDLFACIVSTFCWGQCTAPDPGCVCPVGTGDAATCPEGMLGTTHGGGPGTGRPSNVQCCPCTASDCGNPGCCGESVCAGSAWCTGLTCRGLPASCHGQVNFDCDFEDMSSADPSTGPEDCDMPCCKCMPPCP